MDTGFLVPVTGPAGGPWSGVRMTVGLATMEQCMNCYELGWASLGPPLSKSEYQECEDDLSWLPFGKHYRPWRVWCLALERHPLAIIATCKTVHRRFWCKDAEHGIKQTDGQCITALVTDHNFRGYSLGSMLLKHVTDCLDAEDCQVSMAYSTIGDLFVRKGWQPFPVSQCTISTPETPLELPANVDWPIVVPIHSDDGQSFISARYWGERDLITTNFINFPLNLPSFKEMYIAAFPKEKLISLSHNRAELIRRIICPEQDYTLGATRLSKLTWMCWYHDLHRQQLTVQRISIHEDEDDRVLVIASMLKAALNEAHTCGLPRVVVWNVNTELRLAAALIRVHFHVNVKLEEQNQDILPCVRLNPSLGGKNIKFRWNEFYAWS